VGFDPLSEPIWKRVDIGSDRFGRISSIHSFNVGGFDLKEINWDCGNHAGDKSMNDYGHRKVSHSISH